MTLTLVSNKNNFILSNMQKEKKEDLISVSNNRFIKAKIANNKVPGTTYGQINKY